MHYSTLGFAWKTRNGSDGKTEREYLDFQVDGKSLQDLIKPGDVIGCLGWTIAEAERHSIVQLLLREPSELRSGRVPIYICPDCCDVNCGAVTVRIEKVPEGFRWSDFVFENGSHDEPGKHFSNVGPFIFNTTRYAQTLNEHALV